MVDILSNPVVLWLSKTIPCLEVGKILSAICFGTNCCYQEEDWKKEGRKEGRDHFLSLAVAAFNMASEQSIPFKRRRTVLYCAWKLFLRIGGRAFSHKTLWSITEKNTKNKSFCVLLCPHFNVSLSCALNINVLLLYYFS